MYHLYIENGNQKRTAYDPKGIEEMGRQLVHLQKSVLQANRASEKVVTRRSMEISKKTKENAELIYDLNQIRKINKEQQAELRNKQKIIDNLEREKKAIVATKVVEEH